MTKVNQYEWLIVAEGKSDIRVYKEYLKDLSFQLMSVGGKECSVNMPSWNDKHVETVRHDIGRMGFRGIILVVDSDENSISPFENYCRLPNLPYNSSQRPAPTKDLSGCFWLLDEIRETKLLPVRGINVPVSASGCLETELLSAYGFPTKSQPEHASFVSIIKKATITWNIPNHEDDTPWWRVNETSKMDKFIYTALKQGFISCCPNVELLPPVEPDVIKNLQAAMK